MMKKIMLIAIVSSSAILHAQVGVGTKQPQATFHIKTVSPGQNQILVENVNGDKDLVIDKNGQIGINTPTPDNKLVITPEAGSQNTGLKLPNGAGRGLLLMSDDSGNAYWNSNNLIFGDVPATGVTAVNFGQQYYTGASLTLNPGNWVIEMGGYAGLGTWNGFSFTLSPGNTVITTDSSIWCACSLSTSKTSYNVLTTTNGGLVEGSGMSAANSMARGDRSMVMQGKVLVKPSVPTSYYVWVACTNHGLSVGSFRAGNIFGSAWERWFFAIPF